MMNDPTLSLFRFGFLTIQAAQSILDHHAKQASRPLWRRAPLRNNIRDAIRLSLWLTGTRTKGLSAIAKTGYIAARMLLWAPGSILVFLTMFPMAQRFYTRTTDGEAYDMFCFGYSKDTSTQSTKSPEHIQTGRLLRPRYLCLADREPEDRIISVLEWERLHGPGASLEYMFIAYTAEQFPLDEDLDELHAIAARAANAAGLPAYWIACSCMPADDRHRALPDQAVDLAADLYRISDVVRGSHSLVIIVGTPGNSAAAASTEALLREWGRRMWTFPEVVLSPSHGEITVYRRGGDLDNPVRVRKALFPRLAWADASDSQQLIDHYEGLQPLGYLQLVSLGLKCLAARQTVAYFPGDMVYALQGLLWCRPEVKPNDTAFQAFCRLSLANDSNHLLERLICLCPPDPHSAWHNLDDFWNCKLWNINTSCQVVAVADNDSVILSGAVGCSILWESFPRAPLIEPSARIVKELSGPSRFLWVVAMLCLLTAVPFAIALIAIHENTRYDRQDAASPLVRELGYICAGFFAGFLAFCLPLPYCLKAYTDHLKATVSNARRRSPPHLIGFEGHLDLATIETTLYGFDSGHLRWSVDSSPLSRADRTQPGRGTDPCAADPDIKALVQRGIDPGIAAGQPRIFTLVDTYTMTVTLFRAVHPPLALLLCGTEAGLQRALLCSYDRASGCLYRETVLRVPSNMVEKMHRVDRFRLGLKRPDGV